MIETAAHAAVFETVELARSGVRSLINAILRRALREKDALTNAAGNQPLPERFVWRFGQEIVLGERWADAPPVRVSLRPLKETA